MVGCAKERDKQTPLNPRIAYIDVQPLDGTSKDQHNNFLELRNLLIEKTKQQLAGRGNGRIIGVTVYLENVDTEFNPLTATLIGDHMNIKGKLVTWDANTKEVINEIPFIETLSFGGPLVAPIVRASVNKEDRLADKIIETIDYHLYPN